MADTSPPICSYSFYCKKQSRERHCHLPANPSHTLCAHHLAESTSDPCPIDPSHRVSASKLQQHLKKCKPKSGTIGKIKTVETKVCSDSVEKNGKDIEEEDEHSTRQSIGVLERFPSDVIQEVIGKVKKISSELLDSLEIEELLHPSFEQYFSSYGDKKRKHLLQESSLLCHMERHGLLTNGSTFVELGAGTGGLSRHIQLATNGCSNHILLDRLSFRSRAKYDYMLEGRALKPHWVHRITQDMREVNPEALLYSPPPIRSTFSSMSNLLVTDTTSTLTSKPTTVLTPTITTKKQQNSPRQNDANLVENQDKQCCLCVSRDKQTTPSTNMVLVSKHFCGPAADMAVKFVCEARETIGNRGTISLCLATCCHGLVTDADYCAMDWLMDTVGISRDQLLVVTALSAWASLSPQQAESKRLADPDHMTWNERRIVGKCCKLVLDMGRIEYLKAHGFKTRISLYSTKSVENILLISMST